MTEQVIRLQFNLQLFSEEKTEKATDKKKRDARQKGQVIFSKDIGAALDLMITFVVLNAFGGYLIRLFREYYIGIMNTIEMGDKLFEQSNLRLLFVDAALAIMKLSLPIVLTSMMVGLVASYAQVGFLFTAEPLQFKLDKLNPFAGFKRMFSMRALVDLVKSLMKGLLIVAVIWFYMKNKQEILVNLMSMELTNAFIEVWKLIYDLVIRIAALFFALALFDYLYKRWEYEKDLKMSKQEIKEEYKMMEGDPLLKSKIKEKQRQMAMSRMMQDVPSADVIVTNPTHFAIALRYDAAKENAPVVLAKGQDLIAKRIKELGAENNIPVVENKPLAQALFKEVEIGQSIPAQFYEAVAEVLAYVFSLKKKQTR